MTEILTDEQIAALTNDSYGLANIRAINRLYREQDRSRLWPIDGKLDATERAIRQARVYRREVGPVHGLEYCYLLEIVNNEENW